MAQLNDLLVTGAARFINSISGTADKAVCDGSFPGIHKKDDPPLPAYGKGAECGSYDTRMGKVILMPCTVC